jgi:hypothetical protein
MFSRSRSSLFFVPLVISTAVRIYAQGQATVTLDTPAPGATQLSGHAYNVDPSTTKVVIYALTNEWYVQPLADAPFTNISADGSWTSSTNGWSGLVVLLVNPANYTPAAMDITNPALDPGVLAWTEYPSGPVSLNFSGYTWGIKLTGNSPGNQFDPGPNYWSNDPSVVNVAADGLHLKPTEINGQWQCGEVYLTRSLGYGTYTVQVSSHLDQLDQNTVAAPLFIYASTTQELDAEYGGMGGLIASPYNAQFVVQPFTTPGNIVRYVQPSTAQFTTQMQWTAGHVRFVAWNGWSSTPAASDIIYEWTYTGSDIPTPGQERVHINVWLYQGNSPLKAVGNEMVVKSFSFQPESIGSGIAGYDLQSSADRAFALDYNGSGYRDHIVLYRPGTGIVWIVQKNADGTFNPVYQSTFNASTGYGSGIGGYDLRSTSDRMFAFDYDGTGKLDHLVVYRPGTGIVWILANNGGTFTPVYQTTFNAGTGFGGGIGGYDLRSTSDQLLAFDFTGANTANYLLAYRPGTGIAWILGRNGSSYAPVYQSTYNTNTGFGGGIGGYDLLSPADQITAGDATYTFGTGNSGELVLDRPGRGIVWILRSNGNGTFTTEYQSSFNANTGLGSGIGGYDLQSSSDRIVLASTPGSSNGYGLLYRPGTGIVWTVQCNAGTSGVLSDCAPVYQSSFNSTTGLGSGIGGYDLLSTSDNAFAFDYSDSGALDHLVVYRPGTGMFSILQNNGSSFSAVYP